MARRYMYHNRKRVEVIYEIIIEGRPYLGIRRHDGSIEHVRHNHLDEYIDRDGDEPTYNNSDAYN